MMAFKRIGPPTIIATSITYGIRLRNRKMGNSILFTAYCITASLYLVSGVLLFAKPELIERFVPKLFPLLAHFELQRISNAANLTLVGIILIIIADAIVERNFFGLFSALVLSAWEVYLSVTFYRQHHTTFDVLSHFIIHGIIAIFVGWSLISDYGPYIDMLKDIMLLTPISDIIVRFADIFHEHTIAVAFIASLFGGEPAVIALAFFSAKGSIRLHEVIAIGFSTALIAEIFWFLLGRTKFTEILKNGIFKNIKPSEIIFKKIKRPLDAAPFRSFLSARFISGATIPIIIYFGKKGMSLKAFISYCLVVNIIWTPAVALIGFSSGKGFELAINTFEDAQTILNIIFILGVTVYLLHTSSKKSSSKIEFPG